MKDTCNFTSCEFGKKNFSSAQECFNYKETWWTSPDEKEPVLVKDCAPIRTLVMVQELFNRQIGTQAAVETMRNALIASAAAKVNPRRFLSRIFDRALPEK